MERTLGGERAKLDEHRAAQPEATIDTYRTTHNAQSIDGLGALG